MNYRMVGFTGNWYEDGEREVGWKGDFCDTFEEALEVGCGDNGMAREYAIRTYNDSGEYTEEQDV